MERQMAASLAIFACRWAQYAQLVRQVPLSFASPIMYL